jgi:hypothetical protein
MPTLRTQSRRPTRSSQDVPQMLSALKRLLERQVEVTSKQEKHLSALRKHREIQQVLNPKYIEFQESGERKREIRGQWHNEILEWDPLSNWPPNDYRSLRDIFSAEQLWSTWQHQAAYPNTAKFLQKATFSEKSRSVVWYDSFFPTGERVEQWSSETPYILEKGHKRLMTERMWDIVKRRVVVDVSEESGRVGERLPSRLLRIMDLSPAIAVILLASTPK